MEEISLSRKERERIFRRKEIMDAAVKCFAEKDFGSTTLEEIAGSAEFGKGTLYNYFQGKEEIYKAIIDDVIDNNEEIIKRADSDSEGFAEFVDKYTRDLFDYFIKNKYSFLLFVREIARLDRNYSSLNHQELVQKYAKVKEIFTKRIEAGIAVNEIKKFNVHKLSVLYNHTLLTYIHYLIVCPDTEMKMEEEINFILSVFFDGIKSNNQR